MAEVYKGEVLSEAPPVGPTKYTGEVLSEPPALPPLRPIGQPPSVLDRSPAGDLTAQIATRLKETSQQSSVHAPTPTLYGKDTAWQAAKLAAQVPEFLTTEMVGMVGTTLTSVLGYGFARSAGHSREEAARIGQEFGAEHSSEASAVYRPLSTLVQYFAGDPIKPTPIDKVMEKVTELIAAGGDKAEKETGGVIKSGEVQLLASALMSRFAVKGLNKATARWDGRGPLPPDAAAQVKEVLREFTEGIGKETPTTPSKPPSFKKTFPTLAKEGMVDEAGLPMSPPKGKPKLLGPNGQPLAVAGLAGGAAAAAILSDDENSSIYLAGAAAIPFAKRMDNLREMIPDGDPLRGKLDAARDASVYGSPSALSHLDQLYSDLKSRGAPKEVLESVTAATRDLESLYYDPVEAPFIFPAGGAALLELFQKDRKPESPQDKEIRAMGVLTVGALAKLSTATPIGAIHPRLRYSSRFLDRLNEKFSGTWDFSANQLRQELKKSGAGADEVAMFEQIIGDRPRVTATELVGAFKVAIGDLELTPKKTNEWAPYGLDRIDRAREMPPPGNAPPGWEAVDGGAVELLTPPAQTTIYQSPVRVGADSHFPAEPNLFAWTRSFEEGGIRHVIEVQQNKRLTQARELTPEEKTATIQEIASVEASLAAAQSVRAAGGRVTLQPYELRLAELRSRLEGSEQANGLSPLLPDWYKRIVREEVADAAKEGQAPTMRFATADTVAKVEGWPERFSPQHQLIYDRYRGGIEKFLKSEFKARPYTDPSGHTWLEIDLPTQTGGLPMKVLGGAAAGAVVASQLVDQPEETLSLAALAALPAKTRARRLTPAILAAGGGAATVAMLSSEDERVSNAALTAAVIGLGVYAKSRSPHVSDWAKDVGGQTERLLGNISAEVRTLSQPLLRRLTKHEKDIRVKTHEALSAVSPFVNALLDLPKPVQQAFDIITLSGNRAYATRLIQATGDKTLIAEWPKVIKLLDEYGAQLESFGLIKKAKEDYYPRLVTDLDGLMNYLGKEKTDPLRKDLSNASTKKLRAVGEALTDVEVAAIVNTHLQRAINDPQFKGQPGLLKARRIQQITEEILPFYAPAADSLPIYLRAATKELELATFFGKNLTKKGGAINMGASIGAIIATERKAGRLTEPELSRLEAILRSRFGPGEKSMDPALQAVNNTTLAMLLGNPYSAMVQFGDAAAAVALHGIYPTIKALGQLTTKTEGRWKLADIGVVNHLLEELAYGTRQPIRAAGVEFSTAAFLERTLKLSGFSFVDEFAKAVNINAAANKFHSLSKTEGGRLEILRKYGEYFGDDTAKLIDDLANKRKTDLTAELLFRELSDVQPISKLERPQAWLDNPNGRILYSLKGFMIKQMNLVRERGIREITSGDPVKGASFLLRYSLALGLSGASLTFITNWLRGRDDKLEWGDIPDNVLKTFGWSSYVIEKARQGKPIESVVGTALPPYKHFDEILRGDPAAIQYIPGVGKPIYDHLLGGKEKFNAKQAKKTQREERAGELEERKKILEERRKAREDAGVY